MLSEYILILIAITNAYAVEDMAITVSPGAFFEEIQETIMYDKSIPLIYTQEIQDNNSNNINYSWGVEKYCTNKNTNYCNIMKETLEILTTINKNIEDNDKDILDIINLNLKNNRSKRGIQLFGNLYHFCCNIATEKQLKNVYTNEEALNQQINKFKDVFVSDHRDLINITTELNKYTKNTNNNIQLLKDNFIKFTNEEKTNNLLEKTNHENTIQGIQEIIYNLMRIILKFTNYERDTSTHLHCKLQKIPPRIIESKTLYNDLIKLEKTIKKDGYELTIPWEDLSAYYNLPIAECQFSKTKILIKLKIPIQERFAKWKLYQYIPIHFKFHDSVCLIHSEKTYIANNYINDEHRIISGIGLQHCDPPITELCYIPKFSSDITLSPKCVEAIFKNLPLDVINQYCYFQCIKQQGDDSTIIKQIGIHTYALTNPQPTLKIKIEKLDTTIIKELNINYNYPGLIKISFPCNYELLKDEKILIPKMYPCESNNLNKFKINRMLPASWTKIKSLKTNYEETKDNNMYFTNMSEILNTDWIKEIPNFHVTKQIPNIEKYLNDIILKKNNKQFVDEFLGDIIYLTWLTILTITIGFIIYKIYPVIIKTEFMTLPPPIPLRKE
uniref:Envelope fusion protein n=1 Tax=Schizaphis graminum TaxID=13262 RepID=A0A2S2N8T4_SCHGA